MKYSQIAYWNQFSGKTEAFSARDMKCGKTVTIYDNSIQTEAIVERILLDGEYVFSIRGAIAPLVPYGPRMAEGKYQQRIRVRLEERTDIYLELSLCECVGEKEDYHHIGSIRLTNKVEGNRINDVPCRSAVIIHDVKMGAGTFYANRALGTLAVAFGAYLLGVKDGDWDRIGKSYQDMLRSPADYMIRIQTLEQENSKLKAKSYELEQQYNTSLNRKDRIIKSLQQELRDSSHTLAEQKCYTKQLLSQLRETATKVAPTPTVTKVKRDYLAELQLFFTNKKVCFVGGNEKWKSKTQELFLTATMLESKTFDESMVQNADYLVVNTNFTGHDIVKRAADIAAAHDVSVLYSSKNNQNNMSRDLLKQLSAL